MEKRTTWEVDSLEIKDVIKKHFTSIGAPDVAKISLFVEIDGKIISEFGIKATAQWLVTDEILLEDESFEIETDVTDEPPS